MTIHGRDPALLRRINAASTLRELYSRGPMTLTELVGATNLSRRTAESVLESLGRDGLVEVHDASGTGRSVGRPARTFRFRQEAGLCLGLVVRRRAVDAVLADLSGTTVASRSIEVAARAPREERVAALIEVTRAALAKARLPRKRLRAVTVGTPGVVADDGRITVCNTIPDWEDLNLRDELTGRMRCPVIVENDVNLSARGELWQGAAQGRDSVVWVLTGRITRAAIVIDGRVYRGADGAAGEIGWLPVLGWSDVEGHALAYHRARRGAAAEDAREGLAEALSRGLGALVLTVNPQCLVLGGVCAGEDPALVEAVRRHLEPFCLRIPEVRTSSLGEDSVVVGAVRSALEEVQQGLFSVH